ncbi:Gfo/Idh/MocA family protein [Arcticibacter sp.]|uniref:Gfo/Idh/MocA family protein n=1 Tax=Arcticibacter sp. TaxID=1872630 RepID=UPI00388D97D1
MESLLQLNSRRKFIHDLGIASLSLSGLSLFSGFASDDEDSSIQRIKKEKASGKLGIALVGLGSYAGGQLAPALSETSHCFLAGIVTGTPEKGEKWKRQYGIPESNIYDYKSFDQIKNNPDIDIVYVVLPNAMHAEYVIRAAEAGKHVICEKPMAITVDECDKMIAACKKADRKLGVGYRLHYDPYHLEMMRLGQQKAHGNIRSMSAGFAFNAHKGMWRLDKAMAGGGPLMDLGIYCVQAFCYVTGETPIAVTAKEGQKTDLERFATVEQSLTWQFEMPGGIKAQGFTSYADSRNMLRVEAERGVYELSPAFNYNGIRGKGPDGNFSFPAVNQQARQMDDFALSLIEKRPVRLPGEMGRRDVAYLQAIYQAMRSGQKVKLR